MFDATTLRVLPGYLWPPSRIPVHATSISIPSRYVLVFATGTPPFRLSRFSQSNLSRAKIDLGTSLRPLVLADGAWTGTTTGLAHVTFAGHGGDVGPITLDGRVVSTAPRTPTAMALGLGSLWVSAATGGADPALQRADPATGAPVGDPLPLPAIGRVVTVGGGAVWVGTATGSVVRVRPQP